MALAGDQDQSVYLADDAVEGHHVERPHGRHHNGVFFAEGARRDDQRKDQGADPEDQRDVADIGTDDVAQRKAVLVGERGKEVDDKLGHRRAQCDDRDADDKPANAILECQAGRPPDKPFGPEVEQAESDSEQRQL